MIIRHEPVWVVDTEFNSSHRIFQVGAVKTVDGDVVDEYQSLAKPGNGIDYRAANITGIRNRDIIDAPTCETVMDELMMRIGEHRIAAYNYSQDRKAINASSRDLDLPRSRFIALLALSRRTWSHLESHSLSEVCKYLGIEFEKHHDALSDARAAAQIMFHLMNEKADVFKAPYDPQEWRPESRRSKERIHIPSERFGGLSREVPDISGDGVDSVPFPKGEALTVRVTGTFERGSRPEIVNLLREQGYNATATGVTKKTSALFVGDDPGKGKVDNARKYGVPMFSAKTLDKVIAGNI